MGAVISTFGKIFSTISVVLTIVNLLFFGLLIYFGIIVVPKIKIIMEGLNSYNDLNTKLSSSQRNPPCVDNADIDTAKSKILAAQNAVNELNKIPLISKLIPTSTINQLFTNANQINNIPIC